ncbi:jg12202, partial [Pararge aegeria aegeria]
MSLTDNSVTLRDACLVICHFFFYLFAVTASREAEVATGEAHSESSRIIIYNVAVYVEQHRNEFAKRSHCYLRYPHRLLSKYHSLKKATKTVAGMGPEVFNRIPGSIRDAPNNNLFRKKLKTWLVEKAFYSYNEFLDSKIL